MAGALTSTTTLGASGASAAVAAAASARAAAASAASAAAAARFPPTRRAPGTQSAHRRPPRGSRAKARLRSLRTSRPRAMRLPISGADSARSHLETALARQPQLLGQPLLGEARARGAARQGVGRFRRSSRFPFASCSSHLAFHPMVSTLVALAPYVVNLPETSKKSPTTTGCPTHEQGIYGACNESSDPSALPSQCKSSTPSVTTDTRADPQCGNPAFGRADRAILPGRD